MLPGFRFLVAAIVLTFSIMIFGLGAASLLRSAHEEFVSIPSKRAPETVFAQPAPSQPTLALLRIDAPAPEAKPAAEPTLPDMPPAAATVDAAPADQPSRTAAPATQPAPDTIAALTTTNENKVALPEAPKPDAGASTPAVSEAPLPPVQAAPPAEPQVAAVSEPAPAVSSETTVSAATPEISGNVDANPASIKIATLGGPAVTIEPQPATKAKQVDTKKARATAIRKRVEARRTVKRRKTASRAQVARSAASRPAADPFGTTSAF